MKLLELTYRDEEADWGFDNLRFDPQVTLLVGASGVGKTRILRAIQRLRRIAHDPTALNWGVRWAARFLDEQGVENLWQGEFEARDPSLAKSDLGVEDLFDTEADQPEKKKPKILSELLIRAGQTIFVRNCGDFALSGKTIDVKLSAQECGLHLLSEEEEIRPVNSTLARLMYAEDTEGAGVLERMFLRSSLYKSAVGQYKDLEAIRNAELPTLVKLALVFEHDRSQFDEIVGQFQDVFPYVQEVTIEQSDMGVFGIQPLLKLREKDRPRWCTQESLSAGMRRTLMHLARLALWPEGTLMLIDEFENSLGANCIDVVANGLLGVGRRIQFIITSHHPYIIDSIPMDKWKVIARHGGDIRFFTTDQLGIGRSRHTAFNQLINTDVFKFGTLPNEPVLSR